MLMLERQVASSTRARSGGAGERGLHLSTVLSAQRGKEGFRCGEEGAGALCGANRGLLRQALAT